MCVCEGVRGSSTSAAGILVLTGVHYAFLDRFFVCFKMQVRRWDVTTGINTDTYNGSKAVYAVACPEKGTSQPSAPGACEPASQRGLGTSRRAKVDK